MHAILQQSDAMEPFNLHVVMDKVRFTKEASDLDHIMNQGVELAKQHPIVVLVPDNVEESYTLYACSLMRWKETMPYFPVSIDFNDYEECYMPDYSRYAPILLNATSPHYNGLVVFKSSCHRAIIGNRVVTPLAE